jgi:hypothetical protein
MRSGRNMLKSEALDDILEAIYLVTTIIIHLSHCVNIHCRLRSLHSSMMILLDKYKLPLSARRTKPITLNATLL